MRSFSATLLALSVATAVEGAPVNGHGVRLQQRDFFGGAVSWLCGLAIISNICQTAEGLLGQAQSQSGQGVVITLSNGPMVGAPGPRGYRYNIPYAQPPVGALRFKDPKPVGRWSGVYNASGVPSPCPQTMESDLASTNEDCLYMQLFQPPSTTTSSRLPVFVWVHGGSFLVGGSTAAGLDGSILAQSKNMIVVTLQYRLGLLGYLKSTSAGVGGNMGVKDVAMALSYLQTNVLAFGGDPTRVTLAGQSSGADLIKTLLTVPFADSLFSRAIVQSAPLDYGDQSAATSTAVGSLSMSALGCSTLACLQSMSVSSILAAQSAVYVNASKTIPAVAQSEPIKPWVDGSYVKQDFIKAINGANGGLTNKNRQIIFSTVLDEAAPTIYQVSSQPLPADYFESVCQGLLTPPARYTAIDGSGLYTNELQAQVKAANLDATRDELDVLGTDFIWRCANQQAAVNLTAAGGMSGKIWLAQFDVGITYPSNANVPFCADKVCHEDDIFAVFGTGTNLNAAQQTLTSELMSRWSSFAATGNPNAAGFVQWSPVTSATNLQLLTFNDGVASSISTTQRAAECSSNGGLWGIAAPFDAQLYS